MKKTTLLAVLLASVMAMTTSVQANTHKATSAKKHTVQDDGLKRFNNNVSIKLTEYGVGQDNQGQMRLVLKYDVQNKGTKQAIKTVNWIGALSYNNTLIFAQDIPATFEQPLKPKTTQNVVISVLLSELPQQTQQILSQKVNLNAVNGAKELVFTNGAKIVVN